MKQKFILIITTFFVLLGIASPAYAYLDPGTGSVMLQGALAGFAGVLAILKLYWSHVKLFFGRLKGLVKRPVKPDEPAATR